MFVTMGSARTKHINQLLNLQRDNSKDSGQRGHFDKLSDRIITCFSYLKDEKLLIIL